MAIIVTPNTATIGDEGQVNILSTSLLMSACNTVPVDGPLDGAFWTDLSTGTGTVQQRNGYLMDTGTSNGSSVRIRTAAVAESTIDVAARYTVLHAEVAPGDTVTTAALGLENPGGDRFELVEIYDGTTRTVWARATMNGATVLDDRVATSPGGGSGQPRLLKVGPRVIGFIGTTQVIDVTWLDSPMQVTLGTTTPTAGGRVRVLWQEYNRQAVVLFGDEPTQQTVAQSTIAAAVDVPGQLSAGPVDVTIVGCADATETLVDGFTYELSDDAIKLINIPDVATLTVAGDPVLKR